MHFNITYNSLSVDEEFTILDTTFIYDDKNVLRLNGTPHDVIKNYPIDLTWVVTVPFTGKNRVYELKIYKQHVRCKDRIFESFNSDESIVYCGVIDNRLIIATERRAIQVWTIFKQVLWEWKEQTNPDNTISHLIMEMMYKSIDREDTLSMSACLCMEPGGIITFKFKDGQKLYCKTQFNDWCSEYLNGLLINHPSDEVFTAFEHLSMEEFKKLGITVWRSNEMHLLDTLVFLGGSILHYRAKNLYDNMKKYSAYPIEELLSWFL